MTEVTKPVFAYGQGRRSARHSWRRAVPPAILFLLASACANVAAQPEMAQTCSALAEEDFGFSSIKVRWREADATLATNGLTGTGAPALCLVEAELEPEPGSHIRVVYRLPENWNGELYGIGGGGWAGDVTVGSAIMPLNHGFATMQTDAGKPLGSGVYDNTWLASLPQAVTDFSHRAIHEMTVAGKKIAAAYYGREHDSARFVGCSTGGRMALMEAQRYPEDYDAIVAGSPVYTLQTQITGLMASNLFAASGAAFDADDLRLATSSALATCDARDGLEDGLIGDPRACDWDPATIQCSGGKTASCLTQPQVTALRTLNEGIRSPDGEWALWPISRGSETSWGPFVGTSGRPEDIVAGRGLAPLKPLMFPNREVDWARFSAITDAPQVRRSGFADIYEAKDPNLSRFFAGGGKLLVWGGQNDVGPAPQGVIDYARAVGAANSEAERQFRAFLVPGVGHCGGPVSANLLPLTQTVDAWLASGEPPETLVADLTGLHMRRPVCAWPRIAIYRGEGEPNDPSNWRCERAD